MRFLQKFPLFVLTGVLLCGWTSMAQSSTATSARIVDPIDESQLTVLHGNTHPAAVAKNDLGQVAPDLRMTDMVLVGRSGQQLGQDLRERSARLVVLVTSGYGNAEYETEAPELRTYFLAKPYSRRTLLEKIEKILATASLARAAKQAG